MVVLSADYARVLADVDGPFLVVEKLIFIPSSGDGLMGQSV